MQVRNLGAPVELAGRYFTEGADEVTFLNITGFRDFPLGDLPMLEVNYSQGSSACSQLLLWAPSVAVKPAQKSTVVQDPGALIECFMMASLLLLLGFQLMCRLATLHSSLILLWLSTHMALCRCCDVRPRACLCH